MDDKLMDRRSLTRYLVGSAAGAAVLMSTKAQAATCAPPIDVCTYGFATSATASTNATAIANAIAAVLAGGGGTLHLPPGAYNVGAFTIPASVVVRGAAQGATQLLYGGASTFILIGGSGSLSYGAGISDLRIQLADKDATGVVAKECVGAEVARLYIEGPLVSGRTTRGVVIDGGNASSFFNHIDDVICNHIENGFVMLSSGSNRCTNSTFKNCTSLGDVASVGGLSRGLLIQGTNGDGSVWFGGNFEACQTGLYAEAAALSITVVGARFEANVTDIHLVTGCKPSTFIGLNTEIEYNVSDAGSVGTFVGCTTTSGAGWKNRFPTALMVGPSGSAISNVLKGTASFSSAAAVSVPLGTTLPNASYQVLVTETANAGSPLTYRVPSMGKTTSGFTISASAVTSNSVDWLLLR